MMRRASSSGFTLVELMVSLVAGLIIAIGVVGLATTATASFHEQARISTTENAVRTAAQRLRYDLSRVSFMSTGNIRLASMDPPDPQPPFGQRVAHAVGNGGNATPRYPGTANLQGLRIRVGGSRDGSNPPAGAEGPNNLSTNNGLNPDDIFITGNLTTTDAYQGHWRGNGACGGPAIILDSRADPAVRRLMNTGNPLAAVQNAFQPVAARDFLARLVDMRNCEHFVPVCAVATPDAFTAVISLRPAGDGIALLPPTNQSSGAGAEGCGGTETEQFSISPVHKVRWYIGPNTQAVLNPDPVLDADGASLPAPGAPEIVAEYAVDLKFGIVVENPLLAPPNNIQVFDLDSDPGGGSIDLWTQPVSGTIVNGPGPQRVRSVRFRIATRAAIPDRTANLIVPPGAPYLSRYCLENSAPASCTRFARVRTIVSEVALLNQASMRY